MKKESLSRSKSRGGSGVGEGEQTARSIKKGSPSEPKKKPEPEIVRFNWEEVEIINGYYCDPENRRRKIPQIIAKFPQEVVVTIYGSHYKTKKDREVSHLIHKSRDVSLEPFLPWEPKYIAFRQPRWSLMIHFPGTWSVSFSSSQKLKGRIYRDALQRRGCGSWSDPDKEIIKAFEFFRYLVRYDITDAKDRLSLANLRARDRLQDGLWEGLLPALMKGKFSEAENAINFARKVEAARVNKKPLFLEDHFRYTITFYKKALVDFCCAREKQKKPNPPSVKELIDYIDREGLWVTEPQEPKSFRKNLSKVGLSWLLEGQKK